MNQNALVLGLVCCWAIGWGGCVLLEEPVAKLDDDDHADQDDYDDYDDYDDECDPGDDDFHVEALSFRFELLLPRGGVASDPDDDDSADHDDDSTDHDDDDSAGDDDDSAGDDDDSTTGGGDLGLVEGPVEVEFVLDWWTRADEILFCEQHIGLTGSLLPGPAPFEGGCDVCDGLVVLDPESVFDLGDPADPYACDPEWAEDAGMEVVFVPIDQQGTGDFLSVGLLAARTMEELGLNAAVDGSLGVNQVRELLPAGVELSFVGLVDAGPDTLMELAGIGYVATPVQEGSIWTFLWYGAEEEVGAEDPTPARLFRGWGFWSMSFQR